jgi:hypothetical protein
MPAVKPTAPRPVVKLRRLNRTDLLCDLDGDLCFMVKSSPGPTRPLSSMMPDFLRFSQARKYLKTRASARQAGPNPVDDPYDGYR